VSPCGGSHAAGPYDGEWNGSATASRCSAVGVTLTIAGKVVTGTTILDGETKNINGTVWEDGSFGATIGFQHLTGRFIDDGFEGSFKTSNCVWKVSLKRAK